MKKILRQKAAKRTKNYKNEIIKLKKQREIENQRQEKRINEMAKQIKQKSVEVQGEIQEELIEDFLRSKFPDDDIEEIKKVKKVEIVFKQ